MQARYPIPIPVSMNQMQTNLFVLFTLSCTILKINLIFPEKRNVSVCSNRNQQNVIEFYFFSPFFTLFAIKTVNIYKCHIAYYNHAVCTIDLST